MRSTVRPILVVGVALAAMLALGASEALAHGGGKRLNGASANALVTEAAKQLDVTAAKLKQAITDAAIAQIDEAVEDGDVDAEDADELKERAQESLRYAMAVSRTKAVASNLGVTTTKLNSGFREARKALIVARIDEAVEDGDLDAEEAAELKEELNDAKLPGYKSLGRGLGGFGAFAGAGFGCGGRR